MNTLEHTGDSANIAYYAERGQKGQYIWAEVLSDTVRRGRKGLEPRPVPVFYVRVTRFRAGQIAEFTYRPRRRPAHIPLTGKLVTKLVRGHFADQEDPSDADQDRGLRYGGDGVIARND